MSQAARTPLAMTIRGDFRFSLNKRLEHVKTVGSFATAGRCSTVPSPRLSVEGCGSVGPPLVENTAKAIINVCHQAPFGKGTSATLGK